MLLELRIVSEFITKLLESGEKGQNETYLLINGELMPRKPLES